jgi:hypothetical protein
MLWLGAGATVVVTVVAFFLPEKTPNVLWPLIYSVAIHYYAKHTFGAAVDAHLQVGGRLGSWWLVVGVSLLLVATLLAVVFGAIWSYFHFFASEPVPWP